MKGKSKGMTAAFVGILLALWEHWQATIAQAKVEAYDEGYADGTDDAPVLDQMEDHDAPDPYDTGFDDGYAAALVDHGIELDDDEMENEEVAGSDEDENRF